MDIVDFGHFHAENGRLGTLYFVNDDGQDWYEMRFALTTWDAAGRFIDAVYGAWAMVDRDGVVTNVEQDPSKLMPGDRTVLGIDADIEDIEPGMIWRDGELLPATDETRERTR